MSATATKPEAIKALTPRGKYRLRLAAGLLRARGKRFEMPRDLFYDAIAQEIASLSNAERSDLKALVDWVEAYDPDDALSAKAKRASGDDQ